jgi:SNF2 family DNA or RNA helicase
MATIIKEKRAIILKLKNPSRVTTVIPTAKLVKHKGQTLVAVPHRPDETRVLRQLGFTLPDPMRIHYDWPKASGRFDPYATQLETACFATMHPRCFINNSMGTGKTVSSLWAYDYLRKTKQVRKLLIVCPLSTMERTWGDELFKTFPHLTANVLYGAAAKRKKLLADKEADVYIINIDGLATIEKELAKREDIDIVIIDEVAMFRNSQTERFKRMNNIANKQTPRRVWGLTGMPTPNSPVDAWAQCKLVVPNSTGVPRYFSAAREALMLQKGPFKWEPKPAANDVVLQWMQPSIRYSLDDVTELPDLVMIDRKAEMSDKQKELYNKMLSKLKADYEGGEILAVNEAIKASKLVQIACGVAYTRDGGQVVLPAPDRMQLLKETIEESDGKVIVFVPLTGTLEYVAAELRKDWEIGVVHGATPKAERDQIFGSFQNHEQPHVLVANPGTMSHGLTLTRATTIIWYAPIYSLDTYGQANARILRIGQKSKTRIVNISGSPIEDRIYKRLQGKETLQNILLDMLKNQE